MENENSGVNTVLIVVLLLIVVGCLVWFFTVRGEPQPVQEENPGFNVEVKLPAAEGESQPATY